MNKQDCNVHSLYEDLEIDITVVRSSDILSGPSSRDIAILSPRIPRYPISRDASQGRLALPQYDAIPLLGT